MPLHYLDSSALAKQYFPERGSLWIRALIQSDAVALSDLTEAELASMLARRTREGRLTQPQADNLFATFLQDRGGFRIIGLSPELVHDAAAFLLSVPVSVPLRTLDALHVVSAQRALAEAEALGVPFGSFVTADRTLIAAAAWAGLSVLNPEDYS